MATSTFTQSIPAASHTLAVDQPLMLGNTQYFVQSYGKDHNYTGSSNTVITNADGYHTVIHQVTQTGMTPDPTPIAGVNQIYSKNYSPPSTSAPAADTQLFNITGAGGISQLTGNSAIANGGWCWLGGILKIWGIVPITTNPQTDTITFTSVSNTTIPFPNNCFGVQLTLIRKTEITGPVSNTATLTVYSNLPGIPAPSTTGFSYTFGSTGSGSSYSGFYWEAIGN
jgi:hypothetical protein